VSKAICAAVADSFQLPSPLRDQALRERGTPLLQHRFGPLVDNP